MAEWRAGESPPYQYLWWLTLGGGTGAAHGRAALGLEPGRCRVRGGVRLHRARRERDQRALDGSREPDRLAAHVDLEPDIERPRCDSVGMWAAAGGGFELVLEPVEGGVVDSGRGFDGVPRDISAEECLDGQHLASQLTFLSAFVAALLTAFLFPHVAVDLPHPLGLVHQFSTSRHPPSYRVGEPVP